MRHQRKLSHASTKGVAHLQKPNHLPNQNQAKTAPGFGRKAG
jgi:hypothetical protein